MINLATCTAFIIFLIVFWPLHFVSYYLFKKIRKIASFDKVAKMINFLLYLFSSQKQFLAVKIQYFV